MKATTAAFASAGDTKEQKARVVQLAPGIMGPCVRRDDAESDDSIDSESRPHAGVALDRPYDCIGADIDP